MYVCMRATPSGVGSMSLCLHVQMSIGDRSMTNNVYRPICMYMCMYVCMIRMNVHMYA